MTLSNIQTGLSPEPVRILIHGTEGIGKSTFASFATDPIFIQTEDGLGQLDVPRFPLAENWDSVMGHLSTLLDEKHDYGTVCIDSMDWLEKLAVQKTLAVHFEGKDSLAEIDYGKGYALLIPLFENLIKSLNSLRKIRKMNAVLIAHTKMEKIEDPSGTSYDQYAPRLDKRVNSIVKEWPDLIGFATHDIRREKLDEGFNKTRTVAKAVKEDGNDRTLYLEATPAIVAKSRYKLPKKMPLDGEKFFDSLYEVAPGLVCYQQ